MTINEIINTTKHRPWEIPARNWSFYQEWNQVIFLHWKVEYQELRKIIPDHLQIDLFEGSPWVSLVAFSMEKIRPGNFPSFNPISNFHEINIRTYVKLKNKAGVYFLSIEAANKISCKISRILSRLPCRYSKMNRNHQYYSSSNTRFGDSFEIIRFVIKKFV
ncbi:YqjF family protein [Aquimarina sp. RZ0]|uniref:YqjF family protein n=1 Tax=Aquimarina sp. RZ0 TaxID=2607730 RepID=UPI0011F11DBE|nr:DUF2071 domain-containing protein [Aquimarina sp. RZ0]KAA1243670.1 DUF2071 domain-containing protein [Aquimarina sp. RZ0]